MTFEQAIENDVSRIRTSLLNAAYQNVATAESCTAGLVAYGLTSIAGSSDYFKQGWVVYATVSKHTELCLPRHIEVYGAECAEHLAMSAKAKAGTDWGIGVTGKADPGNGIMWWAIAYPDNTVKWDCVKCTEQDRNAIRAEFATKIIGGFRKMVEQVNKGE